MTHLWVYLHYKFATDNLSPQLNKYLYITAHVPCNIYSKKLFAMPIISYQYNLVPVNETIVLIW